MYNLADEGVQFSPTQLFNQTRRGCSASNGQGVQLGRYIQFIKVRTQQSVKLFPLFLIDRLEHRRPLKVPHWGVSGYHTYNQGQGVPLG